IRFTSQAALMNFYPFAMIKEISPRPVLFIAGEHAHSRYFSEDAYQEASEPKELYIVPGANHVDLYDRMDKIPFEKISEFFWYALR
ncbi:alpha/beta hydrolase, partial [Bacteroides uniformis]